MSKRAAAAGDGPSVQLHRTTDAKDRECSLQWHNGVVTDIIELPGNVTSLLLTASEDGTIAIWDARTGTRRRVR